MEQKEVIEGNRLIAIFMGAKEHNEFSGHPLLDFGDFIKTTPFNEPGVWILGESQVKYHSSWGWIMPVVEKISRIPLPGDGTRPAEPHETFYPYTFGMLSPEGRPMVRICANGLFEADTLIEATWLAVVDFIRWYNQSKQQEDNHE